MFRSRLGARFVTGTLTEDDPLLDFTGSAYPRSMTCTSRALLAASNLRRPLRAGNLGLRGHAYLERVYLDGTHSKVAAAFV
jgi:hypothetical protein